MAGFRVGSAILFYQEREDAMWLFVMLISMAQLVQAAPTIIDGIEVVLPHAGGDILILSSDLEMSLDGAQRTLRDVVVDGKMVLKARDLGIAIPDSALDGMLFQMQKRYGMSPDQFAKMFEQQGYGYEEARELLRRRKMVDEVMSVLIRVEEPSKDEIEQYYTEHPEYTAASYTVRLGTLEANDRSDAQVKSLLKKKKIADEIMWGEEATYPEDELVGRQRMVLTMKIGEIQVMDHEGDVYDVVQLVAKKEAELVPFDEVSVGVQLRQERFLAAIEKLHDELIAEGRVRFCRPELSMDDLRLKRDDSAAQPSESRRNP